jgi:beta-phosphoglucomutase-like phosphatase (HAD superfamily)
MNRLLLFDIDQTLLETSQSHMDAFHSALKKVYGIKASLTEINHHGMTDQRIIR